MFRTSAAQRAKREAAQREAEKKAADASESAAPVSGRALQGVMSSNRPLGPPPGLPVNPIQPSDGESNNPRSERTAAQFSNAEMQRVTQNLIDEIGSLKQVVDKNNTDAATLFGLIDNLIAAYNDKENLEKSTNSKIQELEQLQRQLETALTEIGVTDDPSSTVKAAAGAVADGTIIEKVNKLKDDLSAQENINNDTKVRLDTAQAELQKANTDLQKKEASILELDKAAADKQAAIDKLETEIQNLTEANTADIARLEEEKAIAIAENDAAKKAAILQEQQEKTELQEKFDALQSEFKTKSTNLVQLQTQLDKEKEELEARIQAAETKAAQDLQTAQTESERQIAEATAEAANKASELQDQIQAKATEIDALKSEKGTCDAEIKSLKTQLKIARETVNAQVPILSQMRSSVDKTNKDRQSVVGRISPKINTMQKLTSGGKKKYTRKGKKKSIKKRTRKHVKKMKKRASQPKRANQPKKGKSAKK